MYFIHNIEDRVKFYNIENSKFNVIHNQVSCYIYLLYTLLTKLSFINLKSIFKIYTFCVSIP